ncbi:hypothetical protein K501DRAFT_88174 [Backusella circina FSU 941]|nr:hypothetical protein K501DRAFT_88174 [Backusella circina FSU 941]
MRHLFDSEKSKKSIRLVKQLQDLEDKAFEIEQRKKRQQELDDEAMARAMQAELESESSSTSPPPTAATYTSPTINTSPVNHSPPSRSSNAPPPLPVKPQAYNHSDVNSPTPRPLTPLYSMTSSTPALPPRENKTKAYLPTYKSGVNVSLASPQVSAARPETPVISAAPNGFMSMPQPNYPQRKETPVQHNIPESQYNLSSYPTYHSASNIASATPKPAASNTNPFYNYSGSNTSSANKKHQESRPTESAPSIAFDQQYPAMQPMSAPNYNKTASHSAPSLSHDKPLNEQHRPVMSTTPVSFDSRYNQEPKKHGVTEPFHIVNNNASSSASHVDNTFYPPPSRGNQQQQPYYPNNSSASLLDSYPAPRPKRSSFVEPSITPQQQQYHHQNASSASLLEGYQTPRPKRTSFVEASAIQHPPTGIYQNTSSTHLSSTASFQNVASSIPANPQSTLNKSSLAQKPPITDKTATISYENVSSSNNTSTTTPSSSASHLNSASQSSIPPKPTRPLPPAQPLTSTASLPVETQARPVSKKSAFSDSVLSLKPDESDVQKEVKDENEEDEWDVVSPGQNNSESDSESEYDYSDMIYDRRSEPTIDPFADSFAVSSGRTPRTTPPGSPKTISALIEEDLPPVAPKTPIVPKNPVMPKTPLTSKAKTIIIEPNMMNASREDKVLDGEEEVRRHVEKESQEIEVTPRVKHAYQTPKMDPVVYQTPATVYQTPHIDPAVYQTPHINPAVYQTPHINQSYPPVGEEIQQFFPTNILKAGAPPVNPYASEVSADDYGYYQEDSKNKSLPKIPEKSKREIE